MAYRAVTMSRKPQPIDRLSDVLDQSLKRLDLHQRLDEYGVWPIWNEVVGRTIAQNAQPEKIRNGTLFVKVSSPVWLQQLQFMKEMIADKLNQRLKTAAVKNIFFMVGKIDTNCDGLGDREEKSPEPATKSSAAAAPVAEPANQEFLAGIADPAIREAFANLLKSYARRQAKAKE
jgi:hypothetical protein